MAEWTGYAPDDPSPRRSDYDREGGYIGYRRDLRDWMNRSLPTTPTPTPAPIPESPPSVLDPQITPRPGINRPPRPEEYRMPTPVGMPPDISGPVAPSTSGPALISPAEDKVLSPKSMLAEVPPQYQHDPQGRLPGYGLPGHGMFTPNTPFGIRGIGSLFGAGRYANSYYPQSQYFQPQYSQPQYFQPQYSQRQYSQPQYSQPQYAPPQYSPWSGPNYAPPPMNTGISSISPERFPAMGGTAGASQMRSPYGGGFGSPYGGGFGSPYGGGFGYSPPPAYSAPAPLFGGKAGRNRVTATPSPWGSGGGRSGFQGGGQFSTAFEGLVPGSGGGMDDTVPASIEGREPILVSRDEYVVPADTVSDLGDGSTGRGAEVLDGMVTRTRLAKNGSANQPGRMADIGSGSIGMYQNRGQISGGLNRSSNPLDMALGRTAPFLNPRVTPRRSFSESLLEVLAKAKESVRLDNLRYRDGRLMGSASTMFPVGGNPFELEASGSIGRGGGRLARLGATYRPSQNQSIRGEYRPDDKYLGLQYSRRTK